MQNNPGHIVTKYQFSPLFAKAWYKAIHPENLVAGIFKAGVFPFNPKASKILSLPPGVDEGSVSDEDLDGDLHNKKQVDDASATGDPFMDGPEDDDSSERDAFMLE